MVAEAVFLGQRFRVSKEYAVRRWVGESWRQIGVSERSYYRWRREYGGLKVEQARRLKELEQENTCLKRAKEAAEGNW